MSRSVSALFAALLAFAPVAAGAMTVDSSAFWEGSSLPLLDAAADQGCRGRNVSPPLRLDGVPSDAHSLGVVVFDTDARFVHWVAYGIAPHTNPMPSGFGTTPGAFVGGRNDAGTRAYWGPCPPVGDAPHHYVFSVYALDLAPKALPAGLTRAAFLRAIARHTLASATITGTFAR